MLRTDAAWTYRSTRPKNGSGDEEPNRKLTVHHGDSETGEHDLKEAIAAGINPIPRKY